MAEMEPRWTLQNIRLIFADGFLSNSLLVDLGIHNTCVLRGDYYHLMNINWPDEMSFGKQCFPLIREHLKKMFLGNSETEWHFAYKNARLLIANHPTKVDKLDAIFNNPSYYAGYYLNNIKCHLDLKGSAPAEQNHSSIISYFGDGASWTIMEHIHRLLQR